MMTFVDFLNWVFSDWEHFVKFLFFAIIVGGVLRPRITINHRP